MNANLNRAIMHLNRSGIIAYPTEAVWGLGCDPFDQGAVTKLLSLKKRPVEKGLILIASRNEQLAPLLDELPETLRKKCESSWPGPCTWVLPDPKNTVPIWVKGKHQGVAVRVTDHPLVVELCDRWSGYIISTSANFAGQPPAKHAWQVANRFRGEVFILPGVLGGRLKPTPIYDVLSGTEIRR